MNPYNIIKRTYNCLHCRYTGNKGSDTVVHRSYFKCFSTNEGGGIFQFLSFIGDYHYFENQFRSLCASCNKLGYHHDTPMMLHIHDNVTSYTSFIQYMNDESHRESVWNILFSHAREQGVKENIILFCRYCGFSEPSYCGEEEPEPLQNSLHNMSDKDRKKVQSSTHRNDLDVVKKVQSSTHRNDIDVVKQDKFHKVVYFYKKNPPDVSSVYALSRGIPSPKKGDICNYSHYIDAHGYFTERFIIPIYDMVHDNGIMKHDIAGFSLCISQSMEKSIIFPGHIDGYDYSSYKVSYTKRVIKGGFTPIVSRVTNGEGDITIFSVEGYADGYSLGEIFRPYKDKGNYCIFCSHGTAHINEKYLHNIEAFIHHTYHRNVKKFSFFADNDQAGINAIQSLYERDSRVSDIVYLPKKDGWDVNDVYTYSRQHGMKNIQEYFTSRSLQKMISQRKEEEMSMTPMCM